MAEGDKENPMANDDYLMHFSKTGFCRWMDCCLEVLLDIRDYVVMENHEAAAHRNWEIQNWRNR